MLTTQTALADILPSVCALSRADKLRLLQLVAVELAREEGASLIEVGDSCPVWTPLHAFDAADVLLRELKEGTAP